VSGEFRRIAIVGRGLIGRSIELALAARGSAAAVVALDRADDLAGVRGADLIVLSAPVTENLRLLEAIRGFLLPSTLVTDTGSTKAAMAAAAAGVRFVGGHPIAGSSQGGAAAARPDLFVGRDWIVTPTASTPADDVARVSAFAATLGARVLPLDPAEHDRIFALVSHLPQIVVSALMHVVGRDAGAAGLALAGPGLRDSTRLAASPPGIWRDVLATNHAAIAPAIDRLIAELERLRDDVDGEALTRIFDSAAAWKRTLDERPL
jgi:prephenate dehydrogenase